MKTNRVLLAVNLFVFTALIVAACGAGPANIVSPNPPGTPGMQEHAIGFSAIPNNHTLFLSQKQSAAARQSVLSRLFPVVHAQNPPSIVMTGNYSGYCQTVVTDTQSGNVGTILYGGGTLDPTFCGSQFFMGCPGTNDQAFCAAQNAQNGPLVIGDGTIQALTVVDAKSSVATDGKVDISIIRNGTVMATAITCTLGANHRCSDPTDTFAVLDGDEIVATIEVAPTDSITGVQWFLGKQ